MKKSFILSLVMVVVLIASLATATYAWYTAQTVVSTTTTTISAAETGETLVIDNQYISDPTYAGNSVTLTMSQSINPMIIDAAAFPTGSTAKSSLAFLTTTLNNLGQATASGVAGEPSVLTAVSGTGSTGVYGKAIYVANPGKADATYGVKVTISDGVNKGLRVAVFEAAQIKEAYADASAETAALNAATLVGIWAPASETIGYMDTIAQGTQFSSGAFAGESKQALGSGLALQSGKFSGDLTLDAYNNTAIANRAYFVVAWFEGSDLTNEFAGQDATFTLEFNIAHANA